MKKLTFLVLSMLIGFAANVSAVELYLIGGPCGWSFQEKYKFTDNGDGTQTYKYDGVLTGGFKIAATKGNNAWDDAHNWGNTGSALVPGTPYSIACGGGTSGIELTENVTNPTITINEGAKTLLITGEAGGEVTYYYALHGSMVTGAWKSFLLEGPDADGWYTYSDTFVEGAFGIKQLNSTEDFQSDKHQTAWISSADGKKIEALDTEYSSKKDGSNFSSTVTGDLTFYFNPTTNKVKFVSNGGDTPVNTVPEKLYMLGSVNGNNTMAPNNGIEMTKNGNKFTCTTTLAGPTFSFMPKVAYVNFVEVLGENANDWATVNNAKQYGPEAQTQAEIGFSGAFKTYEPTTGNTSSCNASTWKLTPGVEYTFTLDFDNMTFTVSDPNAVPPTPEYAELVVVGTINGWNINEGLPMETTDGKVYTYTLDKLEAGAKFKVFTNEGKWDNGWGATDKDEKVAPGTTHNAWYTGSNDFVNEKALKDVTITFVYNGTDKETASTLTVTGTEEVIDVPVVDPTTDTYKIKGNFDGWKDHEMTYNDGKYTYTFTADKDETNGGAVIWDQNEDYWKQDKNSSDVLGDNTNSITLVKDANDSAKNITYKTVSGKEYSFSLDPTTKELTFTQTTGVNSINVEAGEVVYFNLQGARVANPENGIFIRVSGSKVEKVVR